MTAAADIKAALMAMADPRYAASMRRFFKTGRGEYAEADVFAGLRNPQIRAVVKNVRESATLDEAERLARDEVHEVRLCGLLILVEKYLEALKCKEEATMSDIVGRYVALHEYINNWDLVDLTAIKIVGNHEAAHCDWRLMDEWIFPGHTLWQRRISMVSTWMLVRKGCGYKCFVRAGLLMDADEDLLHKAAGWMLREAWKNGYREELRLFLTHHVTQMPAVMLSYASERMTPQERQQWQQRRKT